VRWKSSVVGYGFGTFALALAVAVPSLSALRFNRYTAPLAEYTCTALVTAWQASAVGDIRRDYEGAAGGAGAGAKARGS
jgi:hypothetical protein